MDIPDDMQQAHGFAPLGDADGAVKTAILGRNGAKVRPAAGPTCRCRPAWRPARDARSAYRDAGWQPSNLAYGYVRRAAG